MRFSKDLKAQTAARLSKSVYTNITPRGFTKNREYSDRRSKLYREDATGENFLIFRGTDPRNKSDLLADAAIATNTEKNNFRFRQADEKFHKVRAYLGNEKLYLAGHSLGGALASDTSRKNTGIEKTFVFNSGSNPYYEAKDSLNDVLTFNASKTRIDKYSTGVDPISIGTFVPRLNETSNYVARKDGLDPHTIDNFLED